MNVTINKITSEFLEQYSLLEKEIKRIDRRLEYYSKHPVQSAHGVVKTSSHDGLYRQSHLVVAGPDIKSSKERDRAIAQLIIDLNGNKRMYEDMKLDIECFIESIPDIEVKNIFTMRYVDGMNQEQIGKELGYDRSSISKKIDKYLSTI